MRRCSETFLTTQTLTDSDSDGFLEHSEIWKLYGFDHDSVKDVSEQVKQEAILSVMVAFDHNRDGQITMLEWMTAIGQGVTLPDPGLGKTILVPRDVLPNTDLVRTWTRSR